jgi:hypothetical protein
MTIKQIDTAKDQILNRITTERLTRDVKIALGLQLRELDRRRADLEQS